MTEFKLAIVPVTVFQQNCSLLWDTAERGCVIVDPGGEPGRILDALGKMDLTPKVILLTHGHLDHAGGAKALKGELDAAMARRGEAPVPLLGPDARDTFLLDGIEESAKKFGFAGLRNVRPDRFLTEGEVIESGPFRFDVLHCPGHTPGHVVFVEKALRFAFVGDVLFKGSVGRTDFEYGDGAALIDSIQTKLLPLGDDIQFICGHGDSSSFGAERLSNPFLRG